MGKDRIFYLLQQYSSNRASKEEVEEMFGLLRSAQNAEALKSLIVGEGKDGEKEISLPPGDWDRMWSAIRSEAILPAGKRVFSMGWMRVAAAAILLITGSAAYLVFSKGKIKAAAPLANNHYKTDILPGGNKAVLTLANGSTIVLDSAHNGLISQQGNIRVLKMDAGVLAYNGKNKNTGEVLYNAVSTPRGGQYQVVLPDGSKVWLNAASSLRFPTSFAGKERLVELKGEAYFEIAKNPSMPFRVHVDGVGDGTDVRVLGTHFNIMAYANEQNRSTTLLEGMVKVTQDGISQNLQPGRQAIVDNQSHVLSVTDANTEQAVAWKNGMFRFRETGIRKLMREVERWYDVDVEYRSQETDQDFTGIVPRAQNISALLHTLELTGTVHFQVEGRKIIVLP